LFLLLRVQASPRRKKHPTLVRVQEKPPLTQVTSTSPNHRAVNVPVDSGCLAMRGEANDVYCNLTNPVVLLDGTLADPRPLADEAMASTECRRVTAHQADSAASYGHRCRHLRSRPRLYPNQKKGATFGPEFAYMVTSSPPTAGAVRQSSWTAMLEPLLPLPSP